MANITPQGLVQHFFKLCAIFLIDSTDVELL